MEILPFLGGILSMGGKCPCVPTQLVTNKFEKDKEKVNEVFFFFFDDCYCIGRG